MNNKKLTLEEKYEKYKDRDFCVRQHQSIENNSNFVNFKVVGYVKGNNNFLIGMLSDEMGIMDDFIKPSDIHIIPNHSHEKRYIYINLSRIEKYPEVKKVRRKTLSGEIEDLNFEM